MSLYTVTKSERPHITFFGCTNSGKSSLVNAVTNQTISVVSDIKGTTTDPVQKSMEILPLGPVVIIDTAGIDDKSELGDLRVQTTTRIIDKTDIAVLVIDGKIGLQEDDNILINEFDKRKIPYIIVFNKSDLIENLYPQEDIKRILTKNINLPHENADEKILIVSAKTGEGIDELREKLGYILNSTKQEKYIIKDKLQKGDVVILVIPIDESAPKGRIILPQQNVLRECLDAHAIPICCQTEELEQLLKNEQPKLIITDSQAFNKIKNIVPNNIKLTSFSILMAKYKGKLEKLIDGASKISELGNGDTVLISEGCTHHRQCNDIGTVKLPKSLKEFTNKDINFDFTQGGEFPQDLSKYKLIIHCGGCMLNEAEMQARIKHSKEQNIPIVNYGMAIAYMNGILDRATEIFKD